MRRDEKNAQSCQRILDGAMREFAAKGYEAASLNTVCAENHISKGIIYHHFKDKEALYLCCIGKCFGALTAYMENATAHLSGKAEQVLRQYFDARLAFFRQNPVHLALFTSAVLQPPAHLVLEIAAARRDFDQLSISILTGLLQQSTLRQGVTVQTAVEDLWLYMDYFNLRLQQETERNTAPEQALKNHEERCHRQINMLLYGVLCEDHG